MKFTHLHVHTQFSLLDGSAKIKELVPRAKELGMDALAITDHGAMYGVIEFYKTCKANGIKPIIGCEVYVAPGSRFDREVVKGENRYYHLVLLAKNNEGYHNLCKIVTRGYTEGYYYKPRVDMEVLEQYHEGIIALSACLAGEIATDLRQEQYEKAKEAALRPSNNSSKSSLCGPERQLLAAISAVLWLNTWSISCFSIVRASANGSVTLDTVLYTPESTSCGAISA